MSEVKRYAEYPDGGLHPDDDGDFVRVDDFDRVTAERDAALADVDRLDNALNVTDAAAQKWLSDLSKARELFELILDDPRLVVLMSSGILAPIKSIIAGKQEHFESRLDALQALLNKADQELDGAGAAYLNKNAECLALRERVDVLEGLLREVQKSARKQDWASGYPTLFANVDAALKPAEGGGDEA